MLLKELQKLLDLQSPIEEAQKKFTDTYMFVNGELHFIAHIEKSFLHAIDKNKKEKALPGGDVDKLDIYLPETGVYFSEKFPHLPDVFLMKHPKRQWLKSFHWSFYTMNTSLYITAFHLAEMQRYDFYIPQKENKKELQTIYYLEVPVGTINTRTQEIFPFNSLYAQELKDWYRKEFVSEGKKVVVKEWEISILPEKSLQTLSSLGVNSMDWPGEVLFDTILFPAPSNPTPLNIAAEPF